MSAPIDCYPCNGTGIDEASWDGRCPFCGGSGEVDAEDEREDGDDGSCGICGAVEQEPCDAGLHS